MNLFDDAGFWIDIAERAEETTRGVTKIRGLESSDGYLIVQANYRPKNPFDTEEEISKMAFVEVRYNVVKRFQLTLWFVSPDNSKIAYNSPDHAVILTSNCYKKTVAKEIHRKTLHLQKSATMEDFEHFIMMLRLTLGD